MGRGETTSSVSVFSKKLENIKLLIKLHTNVYSGLFVKMSKAYIYNRKHVEFYLGATGP